MKKYAYIHNYYIHMETILEGRLKFKAVVYFHIASQKCEQCYIKVIKNAGSSVLKA